MLSERGQKEIRLTRVTFITWDPERRFEIGENIKSTMEKNTFNLIWPEGLILGFLEWGHGKQYVKR